MKKLIIFLIFAMFFIVSCGGSKKTENDADILQDEDPTDVDENEENEDEEAAESDEDKETATHDDENDKELNDAIEDIDSCDPNPCVGIENSTEECTAAGAAKYSCGCIKNYFWNNQECVDPCINVNCEQIEHTTGTCKADGAFVFGCPCDEGFFWHRGEKKCFEQITNICTGQNKCYDNKKEIECPAEGKEFFGQDAQYAKLGYCIPLSFSIDDSVDDEPVVVDNNLGLMWQKNIPPIQKLYREEVLKYCEELNYGGYNDWRLPTEMEFMTIADYGRYNPALDTEYFPDYGSFWSTEFRVSDMQGWNMQTDVYHAIFDFTEPSASYVQTFHSYYDLVGNGNYSYPYSYDLRCVRGNPPVTNPVIPIPNYSYDLHCVEENTVSTPKYYFISETFGESVAWNDCNNLIFMKKIDANHTWSEALKYCSELYYAGISEWRLPNLKELIMSPWNGSHSSTTQLANPAVDYSYIHEEKRKDDYDDAGNWFEHFNAAYNKQDKAKETFCVANDPCEDKKFWNGVKCAKNPCFGNPCKSIAYSDKSCKVINEENYSCGCIEGYKWNGWNDVCVKEN